MRIIIDTEEHIRGIPTPPSPEPSQGEAINAGPPPESLVQTLAGGSSGPTGIAEGGEGMNAGPPAEWLVRAVQEASSSSETGGNGNAGPARV
jgi:hypothetical protein